MLSAIFYSEKKASSSLFSSLLAFHWYFQLQFAWKNMTRIILILKFRLLNFGLWWNTHARFSNGKKERRKETWQIEWIEMRELTDERTRIQSEWELEQVRWTVWRKPEEPKLPEWWRMNAGLARAQIRSPRARAGVQWPLRSRVHLLDSML